MSSAQDEGREFEKELADELGLSVVPGSGNQWYSQLDLIGRGVRWSLKYTREKSFRLTQEDVREAVVATQGVSGDGSIPLWAVRLGTEEYDLIIMRKNDFLLMQEGELTLIGNDEPPKKSEIRRARSRVPILLREEDDG